MKLYYSPGACSLSPHIVSREAGIDLEFDRADIAQKKTETGKVFGGQSQEPGSGAGNR